MTARRVGSTLAATFVSVLTVVASGSPRSAAADEPAVGDRAVNVRVTDQTFAVDENEPFAARLELTGSPVELEELTLAIQGAQAADAPAVDVAAVRVHAHRAITTNQQLATIDHDGAGDVLDSASMPAADVFAVDGTPSAAISVPVSSLPADDSLTLPEPGIYPVTIEVIANGDVVAETQTFIELFDADAVDDGQPLAVAIMAGIADPGPWPSPTERSSASIEVAKLIELAETVDGPLSILLPPSVVAELALPAADDATSSTTSAPDGPAESTPETNVSASTVLAGSPGNTEPISAGLASAEAFTDAFRADEIFAVPAVALDPSSLAELDQVAVLTQQLRLGEDVLSTASPRAVISRAVWFSRGAVSAPAMVALRNLGIRMLVVPDDVAEGLGVSTGAGATGIFHIDLAADGSLPAITVNDLGAQLQTPVDGDPTMTANGLAVRLLVELQLQRSSSDTPAVLLATPRVTVPDPAITAHFVELTRGMPDISVVPVSRLPGIVDGALAGGVATPVVLPSTAGPDLSERLARVAEARMAASRASRMLVDPGRSEEWNAELTRVLSTAIDDATAFQHLDVVQQQIDRVLGAIVPPEPDTFRLTGTSSTLRLRLENTYDQALNVVVDVRSPKLRFPEPDPVVTIPAGESLLVEIPVEARSNGTFTIEVDVLAPDRTRLADPVILKARVTRLTGLSQVVTGAAVLVLVSWWYSHIRRSRRRRLLQREHDDRSAAIDPTVSPDAAEVSAGARPATDPG